MMMIIIIIIIIRHYSPQLLTLRASTPICNTRARYDTKHQAQVAPWTGRATNNETHISHPIKGSDFLILARFANHRSVRWI